MSETFRLKAGLHALSLRRSEMKNKTLLSILSAALLLASSVATAYGQDVADLSVREETTRHYQLSAAARVEVSHILGSVEIEAVEGNTAEVYFVRSAHTRADLERYDQIYVEQDAARLTLRGTDSSSGGIEVRHRVKLRLPKHCALRLHEINGAVVINGMAGALWLNEINGGATLLQIQGELEMQSINGGVTLALRQLTANGIRISDVRDLDLSVSNDLHAQLDITELDTAPHSDTSRAKVRRLGEKRFQVRIGNGGPAIRLHDVNGKVTIRGV
jgi:hypothetical protein